jgi:acyl-CoA hydrolase
MQIHTEYQSKLTTHEQLILELRSPVSIATGNCAAKPCQFLRALGEHGNHLDEISLTLTNTFEDQYPVFARDGVRVRSWFLGPYERNLRRSKNNIEYTPIQFLDGKRILDSGSEDPEVYVVMTGPMDDEGYFNLGLTSGFEGDWLNHYGENPRTRVVIEANAKMPHILGLEAHGNHRVHISQVDDVIEIDTPMMEMPRQTPDESDIAIAERVGDLVEDTATVQFGIGALPDAVAARLSEKKELGIHTEMFGDGCMELVQSGAVTNEHKPDGTGQSIATFAWGTANLYKWIDHNEALRLLPVWEVNSPMALARQHRMTSINSVLQMDLRGQGTAHCLNGRVFSGLGGHFEHTFGAQLSDGGKSILCLRAAAKVGGKLVSNILPTLNPRSAVTTPEFVVDWVVSEFGAVQLKWLDVEARANALVELAHPDFREDLKREIRDTDLF